MTEPKFKKGDEIFLHYDFEDEEEYFEEVYRKTVKEIYFRCSSFDDNYQIFSREALRIDKKRIAKSYSDLEYKVDFQYNLGNGEFYCEYELFTKEEAKQKFNEWIEGKE